MHSRFGLPDYLELFQNALEEKDEETFEIGFATSENKHKRVRGGDVLTIDDVMAIFDKKPPFVKLALPSWAG